MNKRYNGWRRVRWRGRRSVQEAGWGPQVRRPKGHLLPRSKRTAWFPLRGTCQCAGMTQHRSYLGLVTPLRDQGLRSAGFSRQRVQNSSGRRAGLPSGRKRPEQELPSPPPLRSLPARTLPWGPAHTSVHGTEDLTAAGRSQPSSRASGSVLIWLKHLRKQRRNLEPSRLTRPSSAPSSVSLPTAL